MGSDLFLYFLFQLIEAIYYSGNSGMKFSIEFFIIICLLSTLVILILQKKTKLCIVAGFLYLVLGIILWLFKIISICFLIFTDLIYSYYEENFTENNIYFIVV